MTKNQSHKVKICQNFERHKIKHCGNCKSRYETITLKDIDSQKIKSIKIKMSQSQKSKFKSHNEKSIIIIENQQSSCNKILKLKIRNL